MKLKLFISIVFSGLLFAAKGQSSAMFTFKDTVFKVGSIMRTPGTENYVWTPDKIQFALDRAEILPQSFPYLDSVVAFLKKNKKLVMEITRVQYEPPHRSYYTGMARAREVVKYLVSKGIDSIRLYASVLNQRYPVVSAQELAKKPNEEYKNRFTEFKIIRCDGSYAPVGSFNWGDTTFSFLHKRTIKIKWDSNNATKVSIDSYSTCDSIVDFMKHNPHLIIGIWNHNPAIGEALLVAQARAKSIADYIIAHGIDSIRVKPKGWGFPRGGPPASDTLSKHKAETREEKQAAYQADRRTEVIILSTDYHAIK